MKDHKSGVVLSNHNRLLANMVEMGSTEAAVLDFYLATTLEIRCRYMSKRQSQLSLWWAAYGEREGGCQPGTIHVVLLYIKIFGAPPVISYFRHASTAMRREILLRCFSQK